MKNLLPNIVILLCFLATFAANAQDSVKRTPAPTPMPANAPGAAVGNPDLTVPPIILPATPPVVQKPRKKTAADSLLLMAQADSMAKKVLGNAARSVYSVKPKPTAVTPPAPIPPPPAPKDTPKVAATPIRQDTQRPTPPVVAARDTPKVDTAQRLTQSSNPLDKVDGQAAADSLRRKNETAKSANKEILMSKKTYSKYFSFYVIFAMLVLLVIGLQLSKGIIPNVMQSLLNDSNLRLIYREQLGWGNLPYLVMYVLFWLNLAIFVFLIQLNWGMKTGYSQAATFTFCFLGIAFAYSLKHFVLYIISSVFPITKEIKLYNFIIIISGIVIGLVLAPANIFLAFSNPPLSNLLIYFGIAAIAVIYSIRLLRSLFVSGSLLMTNQFHFLLYICTVEIAPIFILVKFLLLQTGGK